MKDQVNSLNGFWISPVLTSVHADIAPLIQLCCLKERFWKCQENWRFSVQALKWICWMFVFCCGDILSVLLESRSLLHVGFFYSLWRRGVLFRHFHSYIQGEKMEGKIRIGATAPQSILCCMLFGLKIKGIEGWLQMRPLFVFPFTRQILNSFTFLLLTDQLWEQRKIMCFYFYITC